jgi:hypothetical protein
VNTIAGSASFPSRRIGRFQAGGHDVHQESKRQPRVAALKFVDLHRHTLELRVVFRRENLKVPEHFLGDVIGFHETKLLRLRQAQDLHSCVRGNHGELQRESAPTRMVLIGAAAADQVIQSHRVSRDTGGFQPAVGECRKHPGVVRLLMDSSVFPFDIEQDNCQVCFLGLLHKPGHSV